jgi:hypothetical protein
VSFVPLALEERLLAAYARYEQVYGAGNRDEVVTARLELCEALLASGDPLPPAVLLQMQADRAELAQRVVVDA